MKIAFRQLACGLILGGSFATLFINIFKTNKIKRVGSFQNSDDSGIQSKLDYILSKLNDQKNTSKESDGSPGHVAAAVTALHDRDTKVKADGGSKVKVRVLVWVMTMAKNLRTFAKAVNSTWGPRADTLLFMSSKRYKWFPTIGLGVPEGRDHLTAKTMTAFRYVWEHHKDDADWFMKADDDTYVIMENLRHFLSAEDPAQPVYFGHLFRPGIKQGYYSGGAGYVLSREALRRLYEADPNTCTQDGGPEDFEMGRCMERLGVVTTNTSDSQGRSRFHGLQPEQYLPGGYMPDWYFRYDADGGRHGKDSISDYAISFHGITPRLMYNLDFFLYHLRPHGRERGQDDVNGRHDNRLLGEQGNLDFADFSCLEKGNCREQYGAHSQS